ncbi:MULTISPECIES: hypothetical protein [unclassified Pseudomonas]|uniref:hypothetical protein n=1 Tax=unclassified Pseudomonas TaxID=196821 RepID=UPI0021139328|nr:MULTISPECIES: hypothetical protein [unclassified Pseudomonas]UVL17249.1 hypothetical protein LOY44_14580 [Pseudomonas sp. B21-044]
MNTQARAKLRAWMHRPRGSLGWIVAIVALLVAASVYHALSPSWRMPMRDPVVLLSLLAWSVALGWAVQHGVKRTVGKTIFNGQESGWQARLALLRSICRESNVLMGMLLLLAVLGAATAWLAGRSVAQIVENCSANLQAQVQVPEDEQLAALVGKPVCTCLAQTFLERNGVIRLALFETPLQKVSGLRALTPIDEQRCLAQFDLVPEEGSATRP